MCFSYACSLNLCYKISKKRNSSSLGAIHPSPKGLGFLASKDKKIVFENWLLNDLIPRFENRILQIDVHTCFIWGQLLGEAQKRGRPLPSIDALIAASAIQHQLILVTDNIKDFSSTGVPLLNPLS